MKYLKYLGIVLIALIAVILDTSFFSMMPIYGATCILSLMLIINFALQVNLKEALLFSLASIFFLAALSSIPLWILIVCFFAFPMLGVYWRKNYFLESSNALTIVYFLAANVLLELALISQVRIWNEEIALTFAYFVIVNTILGELIYLGWNKVNKIFLVGK